MLSALSWQYHDTRKPDKDFHLLEVVSRYRDPQLKVGENDSYLFNLKPSICKSGFLKTQ